MCKFYWQKHRVHFKLSMHYKNLIHLHSLPKSVQSLNILKTCNLFLNCTFFFAFFTIKRSSLDLFSHLSIVQILNVLTQIDTIAFDIYFLYTVNAKTWYYRPLLEFPTLQNSFHIKTALSFWEYNVNFESHNNKLCFAILNAAENFN